MVQIIPFHPHFIFENNEEDASGNYVNRSPYPIFHLLQEDDVSYAVNILQGDSSKIWKRNMNLM